MTIFLDLRADNVGGIPASVVWMHDEAMRTLDLAALEAETEGRDVVLATHGFNVDRAVGIADLDMWRGLLDLPPAALCIAVLWPGDSRWLPVLDYPIEGDEAMRSARVLASFLDGNLQGAVSLSFASHSLGARMVLETIRQLKRPIPIRRLTLMAGAIEDDCLTEEYRDAAAKVTSISVLASRSDAVLQWAFPVGNLARELISWRHPHWHGAIGRAGPSTTCTNLRAGWQIPTRWDYGHGDYIGDTSPHPRPLPPPVDVPSQTEPEPMGQHWEPAWAAAFVSTRFR